MFFGSERGDFSKNSGILQLTKMGPFWESVQGSLRFWLAGRIGLRAFGNRPEIRYHY